MPRSKSAPGKRPRATADPVLRKVLSLALDMEEPLRDAERFLHALRLIGHGMLMDDDNDGGAIVAIAAEAVARVEVMRERWDGIFKTAQKGRMQ